MEDALYFIASSTAKVVNGGFRAADTQGMEKSANFALLPSSPPCFL
jgi:hypothetical protein